MSDARIPKNLDPTRRKVLEVALAEVGTREATGKNDGPVEKYMPAWARGKGMPYCAWFVGWCWEQALGKHPYRTRHGAVQRIYDEALKNGVDVRSASEAQPGDAFIILYGESAGHTGFVLRVDELGRRINTVEGNWRNMVGVATRETDTFAGIVNPYRRLNPGSLTDRNQWARGLISAPPAGSSLAGTR